MDKPFSLELVPIDEPQGAESAPGKAPAAPSAATAPDLTLVMPTAAAAVTPAEASLDAIEIVPLDRPIPIRGTQADGDSYAAQASKEYAQGHVDRPLWDRALAQANGDATAAAAIYVRARATALRLFDRDRRADRRAHPRRTRATTATLVRAPRPTSGNNIATPSWRGPPPWPWPRSPPC